MIDETTTNDRDRLEAAMRVLADAAALARGRELDGTCVVEEQKRAQDWAEIRIGKQGSDGESVTDPMVVYAALNAAQSLHRSLPVAGHGRRGSVTL